MSFHTASAPLATPQPQSHHAASNRYGHSYFSIPMGAGRSSTLTPDLADTSSRTRRQSQTSTRSIQNSTSFGPPSRSGSGTEPCEVCKRTDLKTYTCVQCNNDSFCDECWGKERAHRPGAVGFDGKPHEKTDRRVVERLRHILEPKRTLEQQQELHRNDEDTTWFGIARDSVNLPIFQDYERYSHIMAQSRTSQVNVRYPQLVSFIGQTGAGKSTLVKMLIDHQENAFDGHVGPSRYPAPVTGATGDNLPTSGDVHLYSDPTTYFSDRPMLYADCEGLDGGENDPRGARWKQKEHSVPSLTKSSSARNDPAFRKKIRKVAHSSQRDIAWATTPETRKREYAVTQLYPRLLYTFSDVVVFVLRNSKVFESIVLERLLDWASVSIEKSLNQPTLPHVIIALNASDIQIDEDQWDITEATRILMSDIEGAISRVPRFAEHAIRWRQTGRIINTTKDLLECYYSTVTVVRIPSHGRYMLMNDQIQKLHEAIKKSCETSFLTKQRRRMLSDSEKLQVYLQSAFDHFSQNLNLPFDFVKEAVKNNPIPSNFGGNILKLAIAMRDHNRFVNKFDGPKIFYELSRMVASCVMLDSARRSFLGDTINLLEEVYAGMCEAALDEFCNTYWPCSFRNSNGRCCNVKSGHNPKGHQNSDGKILAAGAYESTFNYDDRCADEWHDNIRRNLQDIQKSVETDMFQHKSLTEVEAAVRVHQSVMSDFYHTCGDVLQFVSHSTCFSCLREPPEHPLPCGHVLCNPCAKAFGTQAEKTVIKLDYCPLHITDTEFMGEFPWRIKVKPLYAGTRILSLDGGGVRGIVELEVLRAIEVALGGNIPIQAFFDLIVGTSTGGIIALGLGIENWTVEQCINKFTALCGDAFTPRELLRVPLLGKLSTVHHRSMYKTKPFEAALQSAFEDRPLFGGTVQEGHMLKVAVTSTTIMNQQPVVFANYNRPDFPDYSSYKFERRDAPSMELKTWEAARATSAAPPYFKHYIKNETKSGYMDGALYHNNPVVVAHQERKLIWKDVEDQQPDIFLSIGTGHNGHGDADMKGPSSFFRSFSTKQAQTAELPPRPDVPLRPLKKFTTFTGQIYSTVSSRFDSILNCNRIWDEFRVGVTGGPYARERRRYIRINPDLGFQVPKLDAIDRLHDMQKSSQHNLRNNPKIKEVAHRLVASTFFFEKIDASTKEIDGKYICDGFIYCRFHTGTSEMKALGHYLRDCIKGNFEPYFVIQEDRQWDTSQKVPITENLLARMALRGIFTMDPLRIEVKKQLSSTTIYLCLREDAYPNSGDSNLPISGFPRHLMTEDLTQITQSRIPIGRNSGSLNRRMYRRRRNQKNTAGGVERHSSGSSNEPQEAEANTLRRVKSQSNLRQDQGDTGFPTSPADVSRWASRRRKSLGTIPQGVFELADTSTAVAPSEMTADFDAALGPVRKRGRFSLVV